MTELNADDTNWQPPADRENLSRFLSAAIIAIMLFIPVVDRVVQFPWPDRVPARVACTREWPGALGGSKPCRNTEGQGDVVAGTLLGDTGRGNGKVTAPGGMYSPQTRPHMPDSVSRSTLDGRAQVEPEAGMLVTDRLGVDTNTVLFLRPHARIGKEENNELGHGMERNLAGASDRGVPNSIGAGADGEGTPRELSDRSGRPGFATWVHPSLAGRDDTARGDGEKYWPWDREYIASISYPLGTVLEVHHNSNVLIGVVKDRGLLAPDQVDLSEAGFLALAGRLGTGVISVTIREVQGR